MRYVEEEPDASIEEDDPIPDPWRIGGGDPKGDQWWEGEE
jgi:hypothetical protein